ncbi:hypothetical protein F5Y04DRAFT_277521 [Hypomontagnella monticulosa]|nr:hypothetical protein F5Y04DRAFT_277521 [Hypomontagnella monticulosa]
MDPQGKPDGILKIPIDPRDPDNPDAWGPEIRRFLNFVSISNGCNHKCNVSHIPDSYHDEYKDFRYSPYVQGSHQSSLGIRDPINNDISQNSRTPPLLNLPIEIFKKIFEYASGKYDLRADLVMPDEEKLGSLIYKPSRVLFCNTRTWAKMNVFQICRAFRHLAIDYYGIPQRDSLPFSPALDTLVLHSQTPPHLDHMEGNGRPEWVRTWRKSAFDGVYGCNNTPGTNWYMDTPMTMISSDFLHKPTTITVDIGKGSKHCGVTWGDIWLFIGVTFVNVQSVKLRTYQLDSCKLYRIHGRRAAEIYYRRHDMWVLFGLINAMSRPCMVERFARLKLLEVEKTEEYCTEYNMSYHSASVRLEFDLIKGVKADTDAPELYGGFFPRH